MANELKLSDALTKDELRDLRRKSDVRALASFVFTWGLIAGAFAMATIWPIMASLSFQSCCISCSPPEMTADQVLYDLIDEADRHLYAAKRAGRDRTRVRDVAWQQQFGRRLPETLAAV